MNWQLLFEKASKSFYTELLADAVCLVVIILYFSRKKRVSPMRYLVFYAFTALAQSLVVQYQRGQTVPTALGTRISHDSLYVFLIIELCCCLLFVSSQIRSKTMKRMIWGSIVFFIPFTVYYWLGSPSFADFYSQVPIVEGFLIIIPCVYFFYELLTGPLQKNLFTEPAFWSISGMLILFTVITPVFLLLNYLIQHRNSMFYTLYTINNLSYTLLFITFGIAIVSDKKKPRNTF